MSEKNIGLSEQFINFTWLLHRYHQRIHHKLHGAGIVPRGQGRVIKLLKIHPKMSQKDLSYLLDIRPQSLGELLSKLERNGYITRTPSDTDKRVMIIQLTEKGKNFSEETERDFNLNPVFEILTIEERKNLSSYLEKLTIALKETMKNQETGIDFPDHFLERFFSKRAVREQEKFSPFGRHVKKKKSDKS